MDMVRFSNASQLLINHYFTTIHEGNSMIPKQSEKVKSGHTLVPCVLETRVLPMLRTLKTDGALISYQSFLLKGSTLQGKRHRHTKKTGQRRPEEAKEQLITNAMHHSVHSTAKKDFEVARNIRNWLEFDTRCSEIRGTISD